MDDLEQIYQNNNITAEELKELILEELRQLHFILNDDGTILPPDSNNKILLRTLHNPSVQIELAKHQNWLHHKFNSYKKYFANGCDIKPHAIEPELILVTENWHKDLFRTARLTWTLPYTSGFGRRLCYLIMDKHHQKLMGIFGLQSAPIAFPARDKLFKYPEDQKTSLVNQTMDIFTLGAIPPYNFLLAGKLVALATVSNEVRLDYWNRYNNRETEMERRVIPAHLVALTTTSAFGRSSIYNRLKYQTRPRKPGIIVAESLGYTKGYGNFHLQRLYPIFKQFLHSQGINIQGGYGTGPKRTWQLIRTTLHQVGLSGDLLKHGVEREAFIFPLINNLQEYMEGKEVIPQYRNYSFQELSDFWRWRWLHSRAQTNDNWREWQSEELINTIFLPQGQNTND